MGAGQKVIEEPGRAPELLEQCRLFGCEIAAVGGLKSVAVQTGSLALCVAGGVAGVLYVFQGVSSSTSPE